MNNNNIIYILMYLMLMSSCHKEEIIDEQYGFLSFQMDTKSETDIPVIMKSASTVDVDTFHIVIKDGSGQAIKQNFDTFEELKKEGMPLSLPIGFYIAEAFSGDLPEAAFETPCFRGKKEFVIEENTVTEVKLQCSHQSIKVSLKYTDEFLNLINPDFKVSVTNSKAELLYTKNETRSGFFAVSQLFTVHVTGTAKEFGTRVDFAGDLKHIENGVEQELKAGDHLIVTLDAYKETPVVKSVQVL
ncbi:DUF4493 domain-containing protein [Parabacteroides sp. APC149_11_2_Y6]